MAHHAAAGRLPQHRPAGGPRSHRRHHRPPSALRQRHQRLRVPALLPLQEPRGRPGPWLARLDAPQRSHIQTPQPPSPNTRPDRHHFCRAGDGPGAVLGRARPARHRDHLGRVRGLCPPHPGAVPAFRLRRGAVEPHVHPGQCRRDDAKSAGVAKDDVCATSSDRLCTRPAGAVVQRAGAAGAVQADGLEHRGHGPGVPGLAVRGLPGHRRRRRRAERPAVQRRGRRGGRVDHARRRGPRRRRGGRGPASLVRSSGRGLDHPREEHQEGVPLRQVRLSDTLSDPPRPLPSPVYSRCTPTASTRCAA